MEQQEIRNQIEELQNQAQNEIERIFSDRLETILKDLALLYAAIETKDEIVTWTQFNKYNRLTNELETIANMLKGNYEHVADIIQTLQIAAYLETYLRSLHLFEYASQIPMNVKVPNENTIKRAIEQPIEFIKLNPTLEKQKDNVLHRIRLNITQAIMAGEGYSKMANRLKSDLAFGAHKAQMVARTEGGRAFTQGQLDSAEVAEKHGARMTKVWNATLDNRTRDTHQHLDGQQADEHGNFHSSGCVGKGPRLFVGMASAKENINCRCHLIYSVNGVLPAMRHAKDDEGNKSKVPYQTYLDWRNSLDNED